MKKNYIQTQCSWLYVLLVLFGLNYSTASGQVTYTFTTAGATGSVGPIQAQINSAYQTTNLNNSVVATNGIQTFTVPATGLWELDLLGASGGSTNSTYNKAGGTGSRMIGTFNLVAGDVLYILVGQQGVNGCGTGGGGGGTYVVKNNTLILIAAGGGGGAASDNVGANSVTVTTGTNDSPNGSIPGGTNGGGGSACNVGSPGANHGGGGGGYIGNGATSTAPTPGGGGFSYMNGGGGGSGNAPGGFGGGGGGTNCTVGGGGGGGYSGGAGGQQVNYCQNGLNRTGGGGGGSYNAGISQTNTPAYNVGDGRVTMRSLCNLVITSSGSNSLAPVICSGTTLTLTTNAVSNYTWSNGNSSATSITVSPNSTTTYSIVGTTNQSCTASAYITVTSNTAAPVMTVSPATSSVCLGKTTTLTATGAVSYTWNNGVVNGVSFTPSVTSNYIVTGSNGCGTSSASAVVSVAPLPVSMSAFPSTICFGNSAQITVTTAATNFTYNPGSANTSSVITVVPFSTTVYSVAVSDGTCSGTGTVNVTVNPLPSVSLTTSSNNICPGQSVTLTASGALGYTWSPGNTVSASIVVTPSSSINYVVTGTNNFGCSSTNNTGIIVGQQPVITVGANPATICNGKTSTLTASGASNYNWVAGPSTGTYVVNPSSASVYTVNATSATATCVATKTVIVNVVSGSITIAGTSSICSGGTATLLASGGANYTWSPGGSTFSGLSGTPTITTTYTVNGVSTVSSIPCPASATAQVNVFALPTVTAAATRTAMCRKENVVFNSGGASTYLWNSVTATVSTAPSITITAQNTGVLQYTVTGTDANGCSSSKGISVNVSGCTSIEELEALHGILIYPNPNAGDFFIQSQNSRNLTLYNEIGQVIQKIALSPMNEYRVNVKEVAAGVYFLADDNEQPAVRQRIIVTR